VLALARVNAPQLTDTIKQWVTTFRDVDRRVQAMAIL
jgi:hypothetical protein